MGLQFACLGSGSKGNATLIKSSNALLLVDCGFTVKETERRLQLLGHQPQDISAILVTHEHGDHIKGVGPLRANTSCRFI
ncbi:MBL fold metallo-hydrolase [Oceanicoccus sp. KOV_DT_Chl]|uniref:MBL fold metallo-hydrolase n=1 Tax=Oceanicoccus sp. KOV_DT_Chl TaxID=1904639 RepID=UPI003510D214